MRKYDNISLLTDMKRSSVETNETFCPELMLSAMSLAFEMGRVGSLALMIEQRGPLIRVYGTDDQQLALYEFENFVRKAINTELEFGRGCLLNLEHPVVQFEFKHKRISIERIKAAQEYSKRSIISR